MVSCFALDQSRRRSQQLGLLKLADEALYIAKAQDRNLVRCFGPTSP